MKFFALYLVHPHNYEHRRSRGSWLRKHPYRLKGLNPTSRTLFKGFSEPKSLPGRSTVLLWPPRLEPGHARIRTTEGLELYDERKITPVL